MEYNPGDKIKYHTGDENWKNGIVHAVRTVDDVDGIPRVLTYLVDTGRDERVDVQTHNLKDLAFNKKYRSHRAKGVARDEAQAKATEAVADLPDEIVEEKIRQPEQIDVRPEAIKSR